MKRILFAVLTTLALAACPNSDSEPDPIAGDWRSSESIGGNRNTLEIDDDLAGTAKVFFAIEGDLFFANFDVVVSPERDGEYTVDMECDGACGELDFEMECEITSSGSRLECEGDGLWGGYPFEWKR